MAGAIIVIDQPTGAGAGSPGVARQDLWQSQQINLSVGVGGNSLFQWDLLDRPPGSAAALTGATTSTPHFTPDLIGTYRIQLITNGGGPGNVQILVVRVRYNSLGVIAERGWALPGLGEVAGENNYSGNTRSYAQPFEFIFGDIRTTLNSSMRLPLKLFVDGVSGLQQTASLGGDERGAFAFDPSAFAPSDAQMTRTIKLVGILECAVGGQTCSLELYNITDGATVVTITTSNLTPTIVTSAALTVPANLPNSQKLYALRLKRTGGTPGDLVSCKMARLELIYT